MERLTFEGNLCDIAQCSELPCKHGGDCAQKEVWERLKQFEDAFGTPEKAERVKLAFMGKSVYEIKEFNGVPLARLIELAEADKDGRLIVRQCKLSDTLYVVGSKQIVECSIADMYLLDNGDIEYLVNFECAKDCTGCPFDSWERETVSDEYHCGGEYGDGSVSSKDFGKTVFLTKEEAKKALAEMKGETEE